MMERETTEAAQADHATVDRGPSSEVGELMVEHGTLRLTQRARLRRLAASTGVIVLALVVLFSVSPALRDTFTPRLTAMPSTPILPGQDQFYLDTDVPWATVTLDGHPLRPPLIGRDLPLTLGRGPHRIVWRAAPFQPQSCVVSVPPQLVDTCPVDVDLGRQPLRPPTLTPTAQPARPGFGQFTRILQLRESLATLPVDQAQALVEAMRQAVAAFAATVEPGERYAGPPPAVAAQPLHATLTFTLDITADPHSGVILLPCWLDGAASGTCTLAGHDCALLCTAPWQSRQAVSESASSWLAFALAQPTWSYSTADGHVLAHDQPLDEGAAGSAVLLTLFSVSWDGGRWDARPLLGPDVPAVSDDFGSPIIPPACAPAEDTLQGYFSSFTQVRYISASDPAQGCLAIGTINPSTAPPGLVSTASSGTATAAFLSRFGLLVALDRAARVIDPHGPEATVDERSLGQQLAAFPGVICSLHGAGGC